MTCKNNHSSELPDKKLSVPIRIPLTADSVFKYVFGSKDSAMILASMLNAILAQDIEVPFEDLSYIMQEYPSSHLDGRTCHMDIVATDRAGRIVDVEMQRYHDKEYSDRLTVYVSRLISHYTPKGKKLRLQKVICLSLGEQALPGLEGCPAPVVRIRQVVDQKCFKVEGHPPLTVHVNFALVRQLCEDKRPEDFDVWEKWCYYLAMGGGAMANSAEYEKVRMIVDSDPAIQRADRLYRESLACDDEALQMRLLRDWYHEMKQAGEMATARVEGEAEGLKKGREQGKQEGLQNGKFEVAKAMKNHGLDTSLIIECTGLSEHQIEAF